MKKQHGNKLLAFAAAAAMTAMSACGSPSASQSSSAPEQVAMGRYVEQVCTLPPGTQMLSKLQSTADGGLQMYAVPQTADNWMRFSSADASAWTEQPSELVAASKLSRIHVLCLKPDGGLLLGGETYTPEFEKELEAFYAAGGGYSETLVWPPTQLIEVAPDGTRREIPIKLPESAANSFNRLALSETGEIALASYRDVYLFDSATGALKNTIEMSEGVDDLAFNGSRLAVMSQGMATIYDTESGDKLETIEDLGLSMPSTEGLNVTTTAADDTASLVAMGSGTDNAYYFCNRTGLYRRSYDGGVVERILDGTLVSLGMPTLSPYSLQVLTDGIVVCLQDSTTGNFVMKKYSFDPSISTLPDKELRIYALKESKTLRQTMSVYQAAHPDTHVVLDVPAASVSKADALRALNTQLLAGKGPDLLLLDGMPLDSYLEKKVLQPLDETLIQGMLPNLAKASRAADGKLYALPVRVGLSVMVGESARLANITGIATLAELLTALRAEQPDCTLSLENASGDTLLNTFYPIFANTLYIDGKPDEGRMREFLGALGQMKDTRGENLFETSVDADAGVDLNWGVLNWHFKTELMALGTLQSRMAYASVSEVVGLDAGRQALPVTPAGTHTYLPMVQLGITATCTDTEAAAAFIQLALSPEIQGIDFADGLPVTTAGLDVLLAPPQDDRPIMTYGTSDANGETQVISVRPPSVEAAQQLRGWLEALDTPAGGNSTVLELLKQEARGYLDGSGTLDAALQAVMQKLTLLEAE